MFRRAALLLLLPFLAATAAGASRDRSDAACSDGLYHQSGYCPAEVVAGTPTNVGTTTAQANYTIDVSYGNTYICAAPSATTLTSADDIIDCDGAGEISITSDAVDADGPRSIAASGLLADTSYRFWYVNIDLIGWASGLATTSAFTTASASGTDLDVAQTYFVNPSVVGGNDDGTSPANAWNSKADIDAHTFVDGDRLYLLSGEELAFGGSALDFWNNFTLGCYYMDGGVATACHEGSDPRERPTAVSNSVGANCAELPWIHGVSNAAMLTASSVTGTIDGICSDGDLDTDTQKGADGVGLASEPTSSVQHHLLVDGTSDVTIIRSHLEDAKGWYGVRCEGSATCRILDSTGGDHGYGLADDQLAQQDRGDFISIRGSALALIQGGNFRGGQHSLLNVESCNAIARWNTFDGEVGAVGSGNGQKSVEIRTDCDPYNGYLQANRIINTLPALDDEPGATKSRGNGILWRYNEWDNNAYAIFSITGSSDHTRSEDFCAYNNEADNYGFGDQHNGAVFYISQGGAPDPWYASRIRFLNNGIGANQATTAPRFMQWNDGVDDDPAEDDAFNGAYVAANRFVDTAPNMRKTVGGNAQVTVPDAQSTSYPTNFVANQFGVSSLSASTGGIHPAHITSADGTDATTFDVDFPRCFSDGLGLVDGDTIVVNGTTTTITDITGSTFTVDTPVSWTQDDGFSPVPITAGGNVRQGIPATVVAGYTGSPTYEAPGGGGGGSSSDLAFGGVEDTDWTETSTTNNNSHTADVDTLTWTTDDRVTIVLMCRGAAHPISTPSGYTLEFSATASNSGAYVWEKDASVSESDVVLTVDDDASAGCVSYVLKHSNSDGLDQAEYAYAAGLDDAPSIAPTADNSLVWTFWVNQGFSDAIRADGDQPAGMTFLDSGGGDGSWGGAYQEYAGTDATGPLSWSDENGGQLHITFNIAGTVSEVAEAPYTIQGTIPSGWDQYVVWPNEPNTTSTLSGTDVDTLAEIQAAVDAGEVEIVVPDGSYGTLIIGQTDADIYLRAENPGGASFSGLTVHGFRIRLEGIVVPDAGVDMLNGPHDVLFDNVYLANDAFQNPTVYLGGNTNVANNNGDYERVAFINSTIRHDGADAWPFLVTGDTDDAINNDNFILANSLLLVGEVGTDSNKVFRQGQLEDLIIADNWVQAPANNAHQFRMHANSYNLLFTGNVFVEGAGKMYLDSAGDGVNDSPVDNTYFIGNSFFDTYQSSSDGPFTAMANIGTATNNYADNNDHYSASQTSGTSTMAQGPPSWNLFTDNVRRVYQHPPLRTAGASHGDTRIVAAYPQNISGGNNSVTANITAAGAGNSIVVATWDNDLFGPPTTVTDNQGGTYTLDYTGPSQAGFTTRYYRRSGINDAPTSVTVSYDDPAVDFLMGVLELEGSVVPELTVSNENPSGTSLTVSGTGTSDGIVALGHMSLGTGRNTTVDQGWVRFTNDPDGGAVIMLYDEQLTAGTVSYTNTISSATQMYGTLVTYREQ